MMLNHFYWMGDSTCKDAWRMLIWIILYCKDACCFYNECLFGSFCFLAFDLPSHNNILMNIIFFPADWSDAELWCVVEGLLGGYMRCCWAVMCSWFSSARSFFAALSSYLSWTIHAFGGFLELFMSLLMYCLFDFLYSVL